MCACLAACLPEPPARLPIGLLASWSTKQGGEAVSRSVKLFDGEKKGNGKAAGRTRGAQSARLSWMVGRQVNEEGIM